MTFQQSLYVYDNFQGEVTVENCVYEITRSRLQRTAVTCIPLQTHVCCLAFSHDDAKLLLGCIDGSLILFDEGRGATHLVKAAFVSNSGLREIVITSEA